MRIRGFLVIRKQKKKKKDSSYVSLDHCYILLCSKYLFCSYRKRQILFLQSSGILVHRFFEQHGCPSNPSFTHLKQNFCKYSIKSWSSSFVHPKSSSLRFILADRVMVNEKNVIQTFRLYKKSRNVGKHLGVRTCGKKWLNKPLEVQSMLNPTLWT